MGQIEIPSGGLLPENNSGIELDIWKKRLPALAGRAVIRRVLFLCKAGIFLYHVMISIDHVKAVFFIKPGELSEYVAVYLFDLLHISVFPEFVSVTQFDIRITTAIVVSECGEIKMLVFQKIVIVCAVSPVAVAKEDIFVAGVEWQHRSVFKRFIQASLTAHPVFPLFAGMMVLSWHDDILSLFHFIRFSFKAVQPQHAPEDKGQIIVQVQHFVASIFKWSCNKTV